MGRLLTQILVSDSSCLIDLQKTKLLGSLFRLPFKFVIPEELFEYELLSFSAEQKQFLKAQGLETRDLDSNQMELVAGHRRANKEALTVRDCYALVLAETTENSILLTGDRRLRLRSESLSIETHGVLWVFDELVRLKRCSDGDAINALTIWINNRAVFLPQEELQARMEDLCRSN